MTALVQVLTPAHFERWLAYQKAAIAADDQQVLALRKELVADGQLTPNLP